SARGDLHTGITPNDVEDHDPRGHDTSEAWKATSIEPLPAEGLGQGQCPGMRVAPNSRSLFPMRDSSLRGPRGHGEAASEKQLLEQERFALNRYQSPAEPKPEGAPVVLQAGIGVPGRGPERLLPEGSGDPRRSP